MEGSIVIEKQVTASNGKKLIEFTPENEADLRRLNKMAAEGTLDTGEYDYEAHTDDDD